MIEEQQPNNADPIFVGIVCWHKKWPKKGIGVYKKHQYLVGDRQQICRDIIKEFNKAKKKPKVETSFKSYLTRENIMFLASVFQQFFIIWVNYVITSAENKKKNN